jgi:hypothetical protein
MGLLGRIASLLLFTTACYSPDVRDCTVSCVAESDCASGQVCGSDRFCASPELAGQCSSHPPDDGGVPPIRDAASIDAEGVAPPDAPPDAEPTTTVEVHVEGKGAISLDGIGTCDSAAPQNGACAFVVPYGKPLRIEAIAYPDWRFEKWTTITCLVEDETCEFTPLLPSSVTGKFKRDD